MKELVVGNGLDTKSSQGPLINEKAVSKVERHIKDSVNQGARVICGGNRLEELGGTFFEPTVLTDVTNEMPVSREETFGPVAPLLRYGKLLYVHSSSVYGVLRPGSGVKPSMLRMENFNLLDSDPTWHKVRSPLAGLARFSY